MFTWSKKVTRVATNDNSSPKSSPVSVNEAKLNEAFEKMDEAFENMDKTFKNMNEAFKIMNEAFKTTRPTKVSRWQWWKKKHPPPPPPPKKS
jgi:hypothetical protein